MPVSPLLRHLEACDNAVLPGRLARLRLGGSPVGWADPGHLDGLVPRAPPAADGAADGFVLPDASALGALTRELAARGLFRWRDEEFDIQPEDDQPPPPPARVDRGAIPVLGCIARGAHLNGLVRRRDGLWLWVGRRAMHKPLDPGKLDHVAAGGVPAGLTPAEALRKEAAEEAGLDDALARRAIPASVIAYTMQRPEGLRRDRLHVFDLEMPEDFRPRAVDGEMDGFELWPLPRALEAVRDGELFKFNVNLVLIDLFLRRGLIDPEGGEGRALRARLRRREAQGPNT